MRADLVRRAVELVEQAASGEIDASQALASWPCSVDECDDLVATAWHELSHFDTDADIRAREPEYAELGKRTLRDLARKLRQQYAL
jgi:hypothetical protein